MPNLDSPHMMNLMRQQDIKVEPPDYDFHPSPYGSYGNPSPHPAELTDSILSMSNPWDLAAIKTMNQEVNSAVSNYLTSNPNELIDQIAQSLRYTTAGGVLATETSTSLTTVSSTVGGGGSGDPQPTAVCSITSMPGEMVSGTTSSPPGGGNYGQQPVPSPEELDIMSNLQKALAVLEEGPLDAQCLQDAMIIGNWQTNTIICLFPNKIIILK